MLAENFVAADLCHATSWQEFARCMNGHSSVRRPFAEVAESLGRPTMQLWQTNKEDHPQARANQNEFAADYNRVFVPDATCEDEVRAVGGSLSLKHYMSFSKMSHRADLWRYIKLYRQRGNYMDIKMALLCPLSTTMERVYALGDATAEGHRVAESLGGRSLKDVPHLGNLMTSFEGRSYVP